LFTFFLLSCFLAFGEDLAGTLTDEELDLHVGANDAFQTADGQGGDATSLMTPGKSGTSDEDPAPIQGSDLALGAPQLLSDEDLEIVAASVPQSGFSLDLKGVGSISNGDLQKFFAVGNDLLRRNYDYFLNDLVGLCLDPSAPLGRTSSARDLSPHYNMIFKHKY